MDKDPDGYKRDAQNRRIFKNGEAKRRGTHPLAVPERGNYTVLCYAVEVAHNEGLLSHREYRQAKAFLELIESGK